MADLNARPIRLRVLPKRCMQCDRKSERLGLLKAARDLMLLPELGRARRDALMDTFPNVDALASTNIEPFCQPKNKTDFKGVGPAMLRKFQSRAQLACAAHPTPYLTKQVTWPDSPVELFFDIETDPMRDLCYLHFCRYGLDILAANFVQIGHAGCMPASST